MRTLSTPLEHRSSDLEGRDTNGRRADLAYRYASSFTDRPLGGFELRENTDDNSAAFSGYACVYDFEYDVLGGPERGGWTEVVVAGAGRNTLRQRPDVRLLVNHRDWPLARTSRGTMTLAEDDTGLLVDAPALDLRSPHVMSTASAMWREDMDEMSFAFRVIAQEWNGDYTYRRILEYDLAVKGSDVSVVTYPANDATVAQMRGEAHDGDTWGIDALRSVSGEPSAALVAAWLDSLD